jgi:hypothetical protein
VLEVQKMEERGAEDEDDVVVIDEESSGIEIVGVVKRERDNGTVQIDEVKKRKKLE